MTITNLFGSRFIAAAFALLLSGTMVLSSVGPAFDVRTAQPVQAVA